MLYSFKSMDRNGKRLEGVIEADSKAGAAQIIRTRGQVIVSIHEKNESGAAGRKSGLVLRRVNQRDVAEFCRRLATLLRAGVGVVEALETIAEVQRKGTFQTTISKMADKIRNGYTLSESMEESPGAFPPIAAGMVAAAEASGELPEILTRLSTHIEKRLKVRENILSALIYPCIVLILTLGVLIIMVAWVLPILAEFLKHNQKNLPQMAKYLLAAADFAASQGAVVGACILGFILLMIFFSKTRPGRLFLHKTFLHIPIVGKVFRAASTQLWTRTISDLLQSGLSLQESLRVTSEVIPNRHFSGLIRRTRERIIGGSSLGSALQTTSPLFDNLVCKLVIVGENSGTLEEALDEISDFAEDDMTRRVNILSKLFEPLVIVVVGVVVGLVFMTCFQAIYAFLD